MSSNRDISQRNAVPSSRFLDILNYRNRTSPIHSAFGQSMSVQAVTRHLTSRDFPDEPTPAQEAMLLEDSLWELNRQIEAITLVHNTLLAERRLLEETQAAQKSASRRIPPEILLHIFSYLVEEPLEPFAPSILLRVCTRWYYIVMNNRDLWTRVTFELPSPRNKIVRHPHTFASAKAHLARSHPLPVSACIAFKGQTPHADDATAALSILSNYSGRCAKLYVFYETSEPMYATLNALTRFPPAAVLDTLSLTVGHGAQERYEYFADDRPTVPYVFFSGQSPKLKLVELNGIAVPWRGPAAALTGLEELRLAKHTRTERPSLTEFLDLLAASPGLERLWICRSGPRWEDGEYEDITLPCLTLLSLVDAPPEAVEALQCILPYIVMPNLETLQLSFFDHRLNKKVDCSAFLDQFSRMKTCSLRSLQLRNAVFETDALVSLLTEKGTELRELILTSTNADDQLLDSLTPSPDPTDWICPQLTSFTLERCDNVSDRGLRVFWRMRKEGGFLRRLCILNCGGITQTYV
ncbi:hypothetical protein CALVIDRAFT_602361 [Calocera viscosa TUFC12733]|uniref:F-box domain-containing protein n=1 Tax=Calocera viscosa (strain TUFC12733) TaxID=1330018 RepID=A0A167H4D0_CALVF|nr:hypothetical protein CALVIDRAFT_602361 [Calocera viscosa TUFC12733]